MKIKSKTYFTEALASTRHDIEMVFGTIPTSFDLSGYTIDAQEMVSGVLPIDGYDKKKVIDFMMVGGFEASYQENRVFEDNMFWLSGLSAVKGLQILKAMGVNVLELEPFQVYDNPNLYDVVIEDINNALNMGWRVIVPESTEGLAVTPYIKYDPNTGSAGYMIASAAGGYNGYVDVESNFLDIVADCWIGETWFDYIVFIGMDFAAMFPEDGYTCFWGDSFDYSVWITFRVRDLLTGFEWSFTDNGAEHGGYRFHIMTLPWTFTATGLPLPWWWPGTYRALYNGQKKSSFNVWAPVIDTDKTEKYLGISTEGNVDRIENPLKVVYSIKQYPGVSIIWQSMKVYQGDNAIRTISVSVGENLEAYWDGKDDGGRIVDPGDYNIVIEAWGTIGNTGKKVESAKLKVTVFKVEIVEPVGNTLYDISNDNPPQMPQINAVGRIVGVDPDPTAQTTFEWTAQIRFQARNCDNRVNREINPPDIVQRIVGGRFTPNFTLIRGGDLTLIVKVTIGGQTAENRTQGVKIRGTNPMRSDIQAMLPHQSLRHIACHESGQRQFNASTDGGISECPLFSRDGKGGVGIMQITNPPPYPEDHWDWSRNVARGISIFNEKVSGATAYPANVRDSRAFESLINVFNAWRQRNSLPQVQVYLPNFTTGNFDNNLQQRELDSIRGYNGWPASPNDRIGLGLHEYWVPMTEAQNPDGRTEMILQVEVNEQTQRGVINWERVLVSARPTGWGDPDYVNNVLGCNP